MMQQNKKISSLSNIRAIIILLVLIGHSIIIYSSKWGLYSTNVNSEFFNVLKNYINVVQMPIFFMISGYLFAYKKITFNISSFLALLKERALRLLIPFLFFALFWLLPIRILINYPNYEGLNIFNILFFKIFLLKDIGHLWFLPSLFVMFILTFFIVVIRNFFAKYSLFLDVTVSVILLVVSYYSGYIYNEFIRQTAYCFCFFMFGYLINIRKQLIEKMYMRTRGIVIFFTLCLFLASGKFSPLVWVVNPLLFIVLYYEFDFNSKFLDIISNNSFGLYLFHSPLCYITFAFFPYINPVIMFLMNFLFFGVLSFLFTNTVRKSGLKFIIGEKKPVI